MKQNIPWGLIIACLKHEESDGQKQELELWTALPENRALYERLSGLWLDIQKETETYTPDKDYYWKKLQARIADKKAKNPKPSFFFMRYAAAAAIFLAVMISGAAYLTMKEAQNMAAQEVQFTNLNGKSQALLADGSKVWLHNNTSLNYRRLSREGYREVSMNGEAFFEVAHDAEHPFVVQMDGVKLTVYGTKFNIRNMAHSDKVQISLIEGSVGLETSRESRKMLPGETALFDRKTHNLLIKNGDVGFDSFWAQRQIIFSQKTLGYICRYLSRWYNVEIDLEPALAGKYLYTFTLRNEPLEEIMRLIARINPVGYQFDEDNRLQIFSKKK